VVSVNHPKPFGPAWEYDTVGPAHAVEVWNGPWGGLNVASLAFWDARLRAGQRLVAVGGSDTHVLRGLDPDPRHAPGLGSPTTWVGAGSGADADGMLSAIRSGRTFISASPAGPQLYLDRSGRELTASAVDARGCALLVIGESGVVASVAVDSDDWTFGVTVPATAPWLRAQLAAGSGDLVALTTPVWFDAAAIPG
jgi:hypothetical protein